MIPCRITFSDGGRTYDRTQLVQEGAVALIEEWLANGKKVGDEHPIKMDLGNGWEYVIHITQLKERHQ